MDHAFRLTDLMQHDAEIFSLMRDSDLEPIAHLDQVFDNGRAWHRSGDSDH